MKNYTKQDILRMVKEEDVEFIRLQFTDILGNLKNIAITAGQLERALDNRFTFDGSSIAGFVSTQDSDLYLHPDLSTMAVFPWRPQQGKVARLLCNVCREDETAFEGDSRNVLKKALKEAQQMGYTFEVGPECEFFLFPVDDSAVPTTDAKEQGGYFDVGPLDLGENARRDMVLTLEDMGLVVEASHHESAPAQHEIDLGYEEALSAADDLITFQLAVRTIAKRHGLHASFMPKPKAGVNGSGMHINMSLKKDGKNIFQEETDEMGLSPEARFFIGGIIEHMKGMAAITNPLVNSYKRLCPGFEAPIYLSWGKSNRSTLIRIPAGRKENTRIELRSPDPCANPYLTIAVCLMAGLDGIRRKVQPPKAVTENLFVMTPGECEAAGLVRLPKDLSEALDELEKDTFLKNVLGEHITGEYLACKREEWRRYSEHITDWELSEYL